MNDIAYDISLFESELAQFEAPRQITKAPPPVVPKVATLVFAQETMARELLATTEVHEEFIRQYLSIAGDLPFDAYAQ